MPFARTTDPDTSHRGATIDQTDLRSQVYSLLRLHPEGLTNHEIASHLDKPWNTTSPRLRELVVRGKVVDCGEKRPGNKGVNCIVWKAVEPGQEVPVPVGPKATANSRLKTQLQKCHDMLLSRRRTIENYLEGPIAVGGADAPLIIEKDRITALLMENAQLL